MLQADSHTPNDKYNQNNSIKFETESIKSSLCDYFVVFVLVTGDITVPAKNDTDVSLRIAHDFRHVRQKLMMSSLMKQFVFTLSFLCTI